MSPPIPSPIPHGASFIYPLMAALFTSLTFAEASSLLKADLILLICWFPFPIFVKTKRNANNPVANEKGTAIFIDLDKNMYTINPVAKQIIAVLVPDWNIPHITAMETDKKKYLAFLILFVIPKIINADAAAAAWQP